MAGLIALTGASGFIGQSLTRTFIESGWPVRALLRRPHAGVAGLGAELVEGALDNAGALERLVDGAQVVVHCAGAIKARNRAEFMAVNAAGTAAVAKAAAGVASPPAMILLSSLAAREPGLSDYAASKRAGETALAEAGSALRKAIVRPPAVYGPGDRSTLPLIHQLSRGWLIAPGRPDARFSLLYVEDLAASLLHILNQADWSGTPLELDDGTPGGYGWKDLAAAAERATGRRIRHFTVPRQALWLPALANEAVSGAMGRAPLVTRGKLRELYHGDWVARRVEAPEIAGWRADVTFVDGFRRAVQWYKREGWL